MFKTQQHPKYFQSTEKNQKLYTDQLNLAKHKGIDAYDDFVKIWTNFTTIFDNL